MRTSFEVNAMGPLRCVQALLPSLKKGSKVGESACLGQIESKHWSMEKFATDLSLPSEFSHP